MAEISKTARASMVRETAKEVKVETTEEAIRQIRLNLEAKLYIIPERIAKLLAAYDKLKAESVELAKEAVKFVETVLPAAVVENVVMKHPEFDHPAEDENHLVDFGLTKIDDLENHILEMGETDN